MVQGRLPGGGSIPAWVMRVGQIMPFDPENARQDIQTQNVQDETSLPVAQQPGAMAGGFGAAPWMQHMRSGHGLMHRRHLPGAHGRHMRGRPGMHPPVHYAAPMAPMHGSLGAFTWATSTTATKVAIGAGAVLVAGGLVYGLVHAFR